MKSLTALAYVFVATAASADPVEGGGADTAPARSAPGPRAIRIARSRDQPFRQGPGENFTGSAPDFAMSHIAIVAPVDGKSTDWMEQVSDARYRAPLPVRNRCPRRPETGPRARMWHRPPRRN